MTPETERHFDKARQCMSNARATLGINLTNDAGRNAYLAAFHAAQALIFERTGRVANTHTGVHSQENQCLCASQKSVAICLAFGIPPGKPEFPSASS